MGENTKGIREDCKLYMKEDKTRTKQNKYKQVKAVNTLKKTNTHTGIIKKSKQESKKNLYFVKFEITIKPIQKYISLITKNFSFNINYPKKSQTWEAWDHEIDFLLLSIRGKERVQSRNYSVYYTETMQ